MGRMMLAVLVLAAVTSAAWAGCPLGTRYQCQPFGGKMMCGCY